MSGARKSFLLLGPHVLCNSYTSSICGKNLTGLSMALHVFEGRVLVPNVCTILVPVSKTDMRRATAIKAGANSTSVETGKERLDGEANPISRCII